MKPIECSCRMTYNPEATSQCSICGGSGKAPQARKRGKAVRGTPKGALIRELLKTHQVPTVVRQMGGKVGKTTIYEIAKEEKTGGPSIPAERFLARYRDRLDPLMRLFLQTTKGRCRVATTPVSDEEVITFVKMNPEEYLAWERRVERMGKLNEEFLARFPRPSS